MALRYGYGFKVKGMSRIQIRKITLDLRSALQRFLPEVNNPKFPIVLVIEALATLKAFDFRIVHESEMSTKGNMAEYDPFKNTMLIREDVYDRACDGHGRDRLTLAHELGHFLMHRTQLVFGRASTENHKIFENAEWQADCFAGELLFPPGIVNALDIRRDLTRQLGMSTSAIYTQLKAFGRIQNVNFQQKVKSLIRAMDEASNCQRF